MPLSHASGAEHRCCVVKVVLEQNLFNYTSSDIAYQFKRTHGSGRLHVVH